MMQTVGIQDFGPTAGCRVTHVEDLTTFLVTIKEFNQTVAIGLNKFMATREQLYMPLEDNVRPGQYVAAQKPTGVGLGFIASTS